MKLKLYVVVENTRKLKQKNKKDSDNKWKTGKGITITFFHRIFKPLYRRARSVLNLYSRRYT